MAVKATVYNPRNLAAWIQLLRDSTGVGKDNILEGVGCFSCETGKVSTLLSLAKEQSVRSITLGLGEPPTTPIHQAARGGSVYYSFVSTLGYHPLLIPKASSWLIKLISLSKLTKPSQLYPASLSFDWILLLRNMAGVDSSYITQRCIHFIKYRSCYASKKSRTHSCALSEASVTWFSLRTRDNA